MTIAINIRLQVPATNLVELIRQRCKSKIKTMPELTNLDVMDDYFEDFMWNHGFKVSKYLSFFFTSNDH